MIGQGEEKVEEDKQIKKIKEEILEHLRQRGIGIENIILFGSRARGIFSQYSDYDLLIITQRTFTIKEKMEISKGLRKRLSRFAIDVIIKSKEEVEVLKNQIGTLVREAIKEGVVV